MADNSAEILEDDIIDIVLETLFQSMERFSGKIIDLVGPEGRSFYGSRGTATISASTVERNLCIKTTKPADDTQHTYTYYFTEASIEQLRRQHLLNTVEGAPVRSLDG